VGWRESGQRKVRRSQATRSDGTKAAALHQFRIRAKELRYEMELLAAAFPPDFVEITYPVVETLQEHLGEINDHATTQARLRHRMDTAESHSEIEHLRTLLENEQVSLDRSRQKFLQWWTPRRRDDLRAQFKALLADRPEDAVPVPPALQPA
jgi:CHAD domain-containing protein